VYGILDLNVYYYYAHVPVVLINVPPKIELLPPIGARKHRIIFDIDDGATKGTKRQVQNAISPSCQHLPVFVSQAKYLANSNKPLLLLRG
jgi:hypothetical protein